MKATDINNRSAIDSLVKLVWTPLPLSPDDLNTVTLTLTATDESSTLVENPGISIQLLDTDGKCIFELKTMLRDKTILLNSQSGYRTTIPFWLPADVAGAEYRVTFSLFSIGNGQTIYLKTPDGFKDRIAVGNITATPCKLLSGTQAPTGRPGSGCYSLETDDLSRPFRWLSDTAVILFDNPFCPSDLYLELSGPFSPGKVPFIDIFIHDVHIDRIHLSSILSRRCYHLPAAFLGTGDIVEIHFRSNGAVVPAESMQSTDQRSLSVRLYQCRLIPAR